MSEITILFPLETRGVANAKNAPFRHNVEVIQESLGTRESESSNMAKRACLDGFLYNRQIAKFKGMINMIAGSTS